MKKIRIAVCMVMAFLLLPGASVWEGAAAVSSNGELPEGGYYVATNSFPRNTVVEITNLETSKTIRVIVAVGLESPGLLAIVSRDAAEAIGMRNRAIGRIRMTMPSDPIAFSRFIEGLGSSGDPDFDPQASIAANTLPGEGPGQADPAYPGTGSLGESGIQDMPGETPAEAAGTPDKPETAPAITDGPSLPPESPRPGTPLITEFPEAGLPREDRSAAEGLPEADIPPPVLAEDKTPVLEPGLAWASDTPEPPVVLPEPAEKVSGGDTPREPVSPADPAYDFTLIPAEERPPVDPSHGELPRDSMVAPLSDPDLAEKPGEGSPDPRFFIDPIEGLETPPARAETPPARPPLGEPLFSAPVIGQLEKGKYYLQLGAFSKPEAVEAELSKIDRAYPLAVQYGGSPENPLYRILLGPVNLGESGALLQRFKGSGYQDAFIREDG